jgi:hypothetical protein
VSVPGSLHRFAGLSSALLSDSGRKAAAGVGIANERIPRLSRECHNQAGGVVSRLLSRPRGTGRNGAGRGCQPANGPGTGAGLRGVSHTGEQPTQLNSGRELTALLVGGADCGGFCLCDDEHAGRMGVRIEDGKLTITVFRSALANAIRWRRRAHQGSRWCSRGARHDRQCDHLIAGSTRIAEREKLARLRQVVAQKHPRPS